MSKKQTPTSVVVVVVVAVPIAPPRKKTSMNFLEAVKRSETELYAYLDDERRREDMEDMRERYMDFHRTHIK